MAFEDEIVAQDVILTLSDLCPDVASVSVCDPGRLPRIIASCDAIRFAILETGPFNFGAGPLVAALAARGAQVVLVGPTGTATEPGRSPFGVLEKPFTTDALIAVLSPVPQKDGPPVGSVQSDDLKKAVDVRLLPHRTCREGCYAAKVSVDEKNMAWLTAERIWSSE